MTLEEKQGQENQMTKKLEVFFFFFVVVKHHLCLFMIKYMLIVAKLGCG